MPLRGCIARASIGLALNRYPQRRLPPRVLPYIRVVPVLGVEPTTCYIHAAGGYVGPAAAAIAQGATVPLFDSAAFNEAFEPMPTGTVGQAGDLAVYTGHVGVFVAPETISHYGAAGSWLDLQGQHSEARQLNDKKRLAELQDAIDESFGHRGRHHVPEKDLSDSRGETPRIYRPKDPSTYNPGGLAPPDPAPPPPGPAIPRRTGPSRPRRPAPGPEPAPKRPFGPPGGLGPGKLRPPQDEPAPAQDTPPHSNGYDHDAVETKPRACPACGQIHHHNRLGMATCWCGRYNPGIGLPR